MIAKEASRNKRYSLPFLCELYHVAVSTCALENVMDKVALLAILEAKPGKEQEVAQFLASALPLAAEESETLSWFAFRIGASKFGIFDTFANEDGRNAHLNGQIAKALAAKAGELLASPPAIDKLEILAAK
jgi:quinol monooxygenase YgiN